MEEAQRFANATWTQVSRALDLKKPALTRLSYLNASDPIRWCPLFKSTLFKMWGKRMWSRLHLICLALTVTQTVAYLWYLSYHPILTRWKDSIRVEQETKTMLALLSTRNHVGSLINKKPCWLSYQAQIKVNFRIYLPL